jgi:hypothetical protein
MSEGPKRDRAAYMRERREADRIKKLNESGPQEVPDESGGPKLTKDQIDGQAERTKKNENTNPPQKTKNPYLDEEPILWSQMHPAFQEAILDGVRKQSPKPVQEYLAKRNR